MTRIVYKRDDGPFGELRAVGAYDGSHPSMVYGRVYCLPLYEYVSTVISRDELMETAMVQTITVKLVRRCNGSHDLRPGFELLDYPEDIWTYPYWEKFDA